MTLFRPLGANTKNTPTAHKESSDTSAVIMDEVGPPLCNSRRGTESKRKN